MVTTARKNLLSEVHMDFNRSEGAPTRYSLAMCEAFRNADEHLFARFTQDFEIEPLTDILCKRRIE
jgi:hypothetical protein